MRFFIYNINREDPVEYNRYGSEERRRSLPVPPEIKVELRNAGTPFSAFEWQEFIRTYHRNAPVVVVPADEYAALCKLRDAVRTP